MSCRMTTNLRGIALACVFAGIVVAPAEAYIDPGTGSMIFQILAAAFFGAIYAIKLYWQKLKDFFSGKTPTADEPEKPAAKSSENEPPPSDAK